MANADESALIRQGAILVKWGFERYRAAFRRITRTSQRHFEAADWYGVQRVMLERLKLYSGVVRQVVAALERVFGAAGRDEALWAAMKAEYSALMSGRVDLELAETFYNSVIRTVFTTVGVHEDREFVRLGGDLGGAPAGLSPVRTYPGSLGGGPGAFTTGTVGHQILDDYAFAVPYADYHGDAKLITLEIEKAVSAAWPFAPEAFDFVEMLEPVFFRGKGAYLVGRVVRGRRTLPLILALLNRDGRIWVDAVLLSEAEASVVFSFTRSYFHVDVEAPAGMIQFLKGLLPRKPVAELYISLGYDKHGKTELYRDLLRFLSSHSGERFEVARGERGLVMLVFTMPGYDLIFKVIRDVFGITKTVTRAHVLDRYRFVFEHDRAGRLVDTQQFEHLRFHRDRFEPGLLAELLEGAALTVELDGDQVVLHHVYTERRVTPLNLYIREAPEDAVREAVLDFGKALRDLAATNIFPGDLLLKNFGITRSGRVVFYDYDELCLLGDVDFRELPDTDDDERGGEATFYVGPRDVFPQEFINFFGFPRPLRELFVRVHGDLLTAAFWSRMKERHRVGEIIDVYPYKPARRLHGRHPTSEDFPLTMPVLPPPPARD